MDENPSNRRYVLQEKLGEGGMGAVYRALDRLNGDLVAYKQIIGGEQQTANQQQTDASVQQLRLALAREFEVLATLRHPYVISVLDYGFDDVRQPYFTMSILNQPRTIFEVGRDQSLKNKVNLLVQFMQALSYLHRRGVVHCDLKPDNVLVTEDGNVQVVDFGLATLHNQVDTSGEIAGTLAYIAPEVLQGQPVSFAADMYAVGIMAYELFVGHHPFDITDTSQLITHILFSEPDLTVLEDIDWLEEISADYTDDQELSLDSSEVAEDLIALFEDLLTKDGDRRIASPDEAIQRLIVATHQNPPQESVEIRESFLQAAQFIGRDKEIQTLSTALDKALHGAGSSWLLAGESGVGKSRMIDELRIIALVRGILVLRGQEVQAGGHGYEVWVNILRHLILNLGVSDLEASILKPIVPNIKELLDKDIVEPPPLEPQQVKERLVGTIASMFQRLDRPVIIFLEDLHWTTESLGLLQRLSGMVEDQSMMIVGTFRSDERPDLVQDLPNMQVLKLERLSRQNVEELAISMVGASGQNPNLIDFIHNETEGNTFFLVEVLRSLAEAAGQLDKVATMELPATLFVDGVQAIIQNRLNSLPVKMRPLLELAAIMGRQLDLGVLGQVTKNLGNDVNLDNWLTTCVNFAILDKHDEEWRFVHDRLRDGLIQAIDDTETARLHQTAAETIENVYEPANKANALVYHWGHAGNTDKEKTYAAIAGEQALKTSSYDAAREYLERASELETNSSQLGHLHYQIGEAYRALSDFDQAMKHYELAKEKEGWDQQLSYLGLGRTFVDKGQHDQGVPHLNESLRIARETNDKVSESYALYALSLAEQYAGNMDKSKELAQQALSVANETTEQRASSLALYSLGIGNLQTGQLDEGRKCLTQAYEIDKSIGNRRGEAFSKMYVGVAHVLEGQYRVGLDYVADAQEISRKIGDRRLESITLLNLGQIYNLLGEHEKNIELGLRAINIFNEIGDKRHEAHLMVNVAQSFLLTGDTDKAIAYSEKGVKAGKDLDHPIVIGFALNNLGQIYVLKKDVDKALGYLDDAASLATEHELGEILRRCFGHMAEAYIIKGEFQTALEKADEGLKYDGDDERYIAPLMKIVALLGLKRLDDVKHNISDLATSLHEEQANVPEKYTIKYAIAFNKALNCIVADALEAQELISDATEAYQAAVDACTHSGVLEIELLRLSFIEQFDEMNILSQSREILKDALTWA